MKSSVIKFLLLAILASFFYLIVGWFIFDILLGSYAEANTTQIEGFKKTSDFSYEWLYFSCLAYSMLLAFIFNHSTIESSKKAFVFSSIIGVLIACMTDFYWLASSYFYNNMTVILLDIIGAALSVGLTGWFLVVLKRYNFFN